MSQSDSRVWFITGTSSGFGQLLAETPLGQGERVTATARDLSRVRDLAAQYPERARAIALDVTDPANIRSAAHEGIGAFGRVDVLVNNAGYGVSGAIEEITEEEFEPMFQTNVYGLIRTTQAFMPHFRDRRSGHIFNLSSIGGLIGSPGWGFYNTTKFAGEGFTEVLAGEMKPLGVHVTAIEPSPFRTEFLGRSGKLGAKELPEYRETAGKSRTYLQTQSGKQPGDPQKAVDAILQVANAPEPPVHLIFGKVAYTRFRDKLRTWDVELTAWESVTLSADFSEGH